MKNIFILFLCLSASLLYSQNRGNSSKPNIVLILVDDMGWSDLGCYGSEIATPNIDRLANQGIRFTQFYNTAKCFTSRACLLTGLYAQQVGVAKKFEQNWDGAVTIGEVLREAGYRTLWSGKHHGIENPVTRGFDRYYGLRHGASNHFNPGAQRVGEGKPAQKRPDRPWCFDEKLVQPYTPEEKDFYTTDYFTKYALQWLDEYQGEDKPFFLYLSYTAPHDPLMAWPDDIAKYEGAYEVGYEAIRKARFEKQLAIGLIQDQDELSEPVFRAWASLSAEEKKEEVRKMQVYAAMIDRLDQNIGLLLKKLETQNELDNTLILFMSDNGASAEVVRIPGSGPIGSLTRWTSLGKDWANVSNTPLRYFKNISYEGGIRTPLIAYWPGKIAPQQINHRYFGHFIDVLPTLLEVSNARYPATYRDQKITPLAGESFLPALTGKKQKRSEPVFWEWRRGQAVRSGKWKIVKEGLDQPWELYDLKKDPSEQENLAGKKSKKAAKLEELFFEWKGQFGE